jgi:hypothetical protein
MKKGSEGSVSRDIDIVEDTTIRVKTILGGAIAVIMTVAGAAMEFRDIKRDISDITNVSISRVNERYGDLKVDVANLMVESAASKTEITKLIAENTKQIDLGDSKLRESIRDLGIRVTDMEDRVVRLKIDILKATKESETKIAELDKRIDKLTREMDKLGK